MRKLSYLVPGFFLLLVLMLVGSYRYLGEASEKTEMSFSMDDAIKHNIFLYQPRLEKELIEVNGFKYPIREVWIEQWVRIEYRWGIIPYGIPMGYRLVLTLTVPFDSPEANNLLLGAFPICNDAIWLTAVVPSAREDMWLFSGAVNEPFPQSVRFAFKAFQ